MDVWKDISEKDIDALEKHWKESQPHKAALEKLDLKGPSVLDVGCGTGQFCEFLSSRFAMYAGADSSERMLARARALHPKAHFVNVNLFGLGPVKADTIFCWSVLIHFTYQNMLRAVAALKNAAARKVVFNIYMTGSKTVLIEKCSMEASLLFVNPADLGRDIGPILSGWGIDIRPYHKTEHFKDFDFRRNVVILERLK